MEPGKWDITVILSEKKAYKTLCANFCISYLIITWMWRGKISFIFRKTLRLHQILATLSLKEMLVLYSDIIKRNIKLYKVQPIISK